jgi:hypothetical protein
MADFNIRSDSVDVEQIMKQIRARVREKRGVDYTEEQIRELAAVRLEKFLDPKNLRSDLLEEFRRSRPALPTEPPPVEPPYEFTDETLFETHRGLLRFIRKLLKPILKLFFNPNPLINVLHTQAQFNVDLLKREQRRQLEFDRSRAEWNALYYEVLHNLVLETTRSGIEIKNLKMRVEALASRLDFSERRVRALEGVVQYRPEALRRPERAGGAEADELAGADAEGAAQPGQPGEGGRRRRRRRRGRRGGAGTVAVAGAAGVQQPDEGAEGVESAFPQSEPAMEQGEDAIGQEQPSAFDEPERSTEDTRRPEPANYQEDSLHTGTGDDDRPTRDTSPAAGEDQGMRDDQGQGPSFGSPERSDDNQQ